MGKKIKIVFIIFTLIIVAEIITLIPLNEKSEEHIMNTRLYAESIVDICSEEAYKPLCYEQEVPKLLNTLPVEEVFDVIREIKSIDASYNFCHVLAHELGEQEVAKDPKNWIDVIAKGPADGLCSNGFIHGAAVARFSQEVLNDEEIESIIPELNIACEKRDGWNPTGLDQAICYHGIGHVLLHLTGARVDKSLEVCEEVALKENGKDYRQVCDEGVFMQIFQPLEPEDYALIEELSVQPTKETLGDFCGVYTAPMEEGACWREGWPLYSDELTTAEGIVKFCQNSPNEQQLGNCYNTVLSIKGRQGLDNPQELAALCNGLPNGPKENCFMRSAGAYPEEDKSQMQEAVNFCGYADDEEVQDACYKHLVNISDFIFHPDSPQIEELCLLLPAELEVYCNNKDN